MTEALRTLRTVVFILWGSAAALWLVAIGTGAQSVPGDGTAASMSQVAGWLTSFAMLALLLWLTARALTVERGRESGD